MTPEVTARLRPRTGWESQDLGLAMVRQLAPRLLTQWLCLLLPLWAALTGLLWNHPGWLLFFVWWLKPVYDRLPLFVLGRKLFGQDTRLAEVFRAAPRLLLLGNFYFLTLGRFSPHRSLSLPVKILEGGKLSEYRRRVQVLKHQGDASGSWVTLGWFLISIFTALGLHLVLGSLSLEASDSESGNFLIRLFTDRHWHFTNEAWRQAAFLYMGSLTLTEMFYVGSGFGIYLNSRSHLEGWDIEVSFRLLAARLQEQLRLLIVLSVGWCALGSPLHAVTASALTPTTQELVKEIKAHPDFKVHEETNTVSDDVSEPSNFKWPAWDLSWLGTLLHFFWWSLVTALVVGLLWLLVKYRHLFVGGLRLSKLASRATAQVVMGLDVSPEALPADIPRAAWQCWLKGDLHGAMRLLYAGSLHWMLHRGGLPIRESDTEGDCVQHSTLLSDPAQTHYFQALTQTWMRHTYGQAPPAMQEMEHLVQQWPFKR